MTIAVRIRAWLRRFAKLTALIEDSLLVVMLITMIAIAVSQILLRNFFDFGIAWGDPVLRTLVLWIGMLGAMIASRTENHISMDLLSHFLPPLMKKGSRVLTDLFTVGICSILSYYAWLFVRYEYQDGSELFSGLPAWWAEAILPLGFALIGLRYLFSLFKMLWPDEEGVT